MKLRGWLGRLASPRGAQAGEPSFEEARSAGLEALLQGDAEGAETALRHAVHLAPSAADTHLHLAEALRRQGKYDEALASCLDAVNLAPGIALAHNNLGNAYKDVGDVQNATASYQKALELDGRLAESHLNLGIVLFQAGSPAQARECYLAAIALKPGLAEAHLNLGYLEEQEGNADLARARYEDAIAADPHDAEAHVNYALQLLRAGDYARGWDEYEWRWRLPQWSAGRPHAALPLWRGKPLQGETVLLHAEQGFGDAIQFLRYAPLVAARGARVAVQCAKPLQRLFAAAPGVAQAASFDAPALAASFCCPLLSLPRVFGTTPENIPARVPYLSADPARRRHWREKLAAEPAVLKVGLFWATQGMSTARTKSIELGMLAPLARAEGTVFYSLQRGPAAAQAGNPPAGMKVIDLSGALQDFADDAALVSELDLVISIDTALAHLAGALGCSTWTLISHPAEWRWRPEGERSPWYPTMRLFRQQRAGDWDEVVERVALALGELRAATGCSGP